MYLFSSSEETKDGFVLRVLCLVAVFPVFTVCLTFAHLSPMYACFVLFTLELYVW